MSAFFYNNSGNTVYYYQRGESSWSFGSAISNGSNLMLPESDTFGFTTNSTLSAGSITDSTQFDEGVFVPSAYPSVGDMSKIGTASTSNCGGSACDVTLAANSSYSNPTSGTDNTAPTVSSVAITSGSSGYTNNFLSLGDTLSISVVFSENVVVNTSGGTPRITINVGGNNRNASYVSGSGSSTLVFSYTISSSDVNDSDGISIGSNAISANGGTIKDAANNTANLNHSAVAANSSFKVDVVAPFVKSITSTSASGVYKAGDSVNIKINFSEDVYMTSGALQVHLKLGNVERILSISNWSGVSTGGVSTLSTTYTVQAGESSARLEVEKLTQHSGAVRDLAGNQLDFTIDENRNLSNFKKIIISLNKDVSNQSKHDITADRVLQHIKSNSIDEHTGRQVPFRLSFAGISAIRGQSTEAGSFYRVHKGNTQQNN